MQEAAADEVARHFEHQATWADNLQTTRDLTASPRMILGRQGIGSEERARIEQSLQGCGSQELIAYSKLFLAEGNAIGQACVLSEQARNPKRHSQLNPAEYAEQCVGDSFKNTRALLDEADMLLNALTDSRDTFNRTGEMDPKMAIKQGLLARSVEQSKAAMLERNRQEGERQAAEQKAAQA
jgi:hypothetical protein